MSGFSVATIDSPEFVNITSVNPLVSKCEIKVLYVGENRNRSYITKDVALEMAQSLPGCPIVGYFINNKEDFGDHGEQVIIDSEGVKFNKLTKPYGFVAPDSKVQFQKFEDTDEFGNKVIRDYLMTEGYLQTGQYQECQRVVDKGNPQSMELDEKSLKGHWSTDNNRGIEFFIINDAIFSKLCILGDDVEPCFEGASISAPEVSSHFSKNDEFTKTLFTMIKELKELTFSLQDKGGSSMDENKEPVVVEDKQPTETSIEENFSNSEDKVSSETIAKNQNNIEEFTKNDKEEDKEDDKKEESAPEEKEEDKKEDDDKEEKKPKSDHSLEEEFALVKTELEELKSQYSLLQAERDELVAFKNSVEDEKKDALINSFYMLSDEDKKEIVENKSKYSLEDIEAKLSVICVRKKVSFAKEEEEKEDKQPALIYSINQVEDETLPAWLKAAEDRRKKNN